MLTSRLVMPKC